MRYLVLGCGAIGGTVAADLARDGHDVLVSDADPAVVAAVNSKGLRIQGPVEEFTAYPRAVPPDALPAVLDCPVLLAVKAHHAAQAARTLVGRLKGDGFVVPLQNGLPFAVADAVGEDRTVGAVVNFGADVLEPGVVLRGNRASFLVGELDGRPSDRVQSLVADLADAVATTEILSYIWSKEAYAATLAATAVSDIPIHAVFADPAYRRLLTAVAAEVLAQAPVRALPLDGFDPADLDGSLHRMAEFNRRSAKTHTGIYRDLAIRHRPTEVEAILGPLQGALLRRLAELLKAIELGERSCSRANLDLLATHERLFRLGRPLNAVVSVAGAPRRAAHGPLKDRPVAVKDIISVAGLPTRCGSPASNPNPATSDAPVVSRLRAAGAEVFATTQCLEFAAGFAHPDIGDTRNPRDPSRTSGGSSGGSAALVGAGVCDLAIGTDTGGSIRIPAAYCGIVGLKPTHGLVPVTGVHPLSASCDHVGTLTATVAGATELLPVIASLRTKDLLPSAPTRTVGVLATQLADPSVTPEVRQALNTAIDALATAGWEVREIRQPWLGELPRWEQALFAIVASDAYQVHRDRDTSKYAEGTRALLDHGRRITPAQIAWAQADREILRTQIDASLDGVDVLAGPTVGYVAPAQDPPFGTDDDNAESRFTGPYNLTGHPAISIPVPATGLPAGLQLAGHYGADMALLRAAAGIERVLAGMREE